ncbi:MAG: Cytochrome c-type protein NrfH [Chloroflexi bacterium ADurb.Bin325]|nr:MAG: Cytochrome c-type protein NrfH [Chloroflexi bacterium ADurb.Bin325]
MSNAPPGERAGRPLARLFSAFPLWIWLALAGLFGGAAGLGGFTFAYAQGFSYLSNDPQACVNCHIMRDQYDAWNRGSHKAVAVCNDCHTPHNNIISKYAVKGINGFRHSYAFTTGDFHEPIQITAMNRDVTEHACLYCHGNFVADIAHADSENPTDCLTCHEGVGHDH